MLRWWACMEKALKACFFINKYITESSQGRAQHAQLCAPQVHVALYGKCCEVLPSGDAITHGEALQFVPVLWAFRRGRAECRGVFHQNAFSVEITVSWGGGFGVVLKILIGKTKSPWELQHHASSINAGKRCCAGVSPHTSLSCGRVTHLSTCEKKHTILFWPLHASESSLLEHLQ